jgi:hypothetical protein
MTEGESHHWVGSRPHNAWGRLFDHIVSEGGDNLFIARSERTPDAVDSVLSKDSIITRSGCETGQVLVFVIEDVDALLV